MRLLKPLTLTLLTSTALFAQTTMCFKENHNSMSTIEKTKLDGGECKSIYNIKDMKENGWTVDDIKITTTNEGKYNFIYIFKDSKSSSNFVTTNSNLSSEELEARIVKRLEAKKEQEKKEQEIERKIKAKEEGKKLYVNKCQSCHGQKGELNAMNASRPLNTLSYEEMQIAINAYISYDRDNDDERYGNGRAIIMQPYAASTTEEDLKNISNYLKSINK
ncbi:c-type cytochrome [Arcobacter roscoffensis]|uniref:Cytochrome c n=1 Tax=Arcobacter roscoffensis TaxID=2961520 RepID=A0ABY5E3X3_9BACT|nr:cytochrome c [Arcobacter roscoffensis]UTJ06857.1 cytochrome c [Arcobacter roscoffensis]